VDRDTVSALYKLLRDVHLATALFSAFFLIAYGLSAAQMAYPVYDADPVERVTTIDVPQEVAATPRALAQWLMDQHGFRGDLRELDAAGTAITLTIARTGTTHRVEYDSEAQAARVTTGVLSTIDMLNRLHHLRGVTHGYWAANAWGWFLLAVSVGLLVLAGTGVVMWFVRHRERRLGAFVFGAGLVWGLTLLLLIRLA
jgi:hypothetical protein